MKALDRLRPPSALFLKSGVAFLDQAILSATNFVTAIVLMKAVPKDEYGYYSIAFAASLFLISLQNAVVTTPLAVLLAGKHGREREDYAGALFWGQLITVIPLALLGVGATAILYSVGIAGILTFTVGAVCFAAVGILLREFCRAYYFAKQSPGTVLALDSCHALACLALIGFAYASSRLSTPLAFILMGSSALLSSALFKPRDWKFHWRAVRESYRENWPFAKWSLTGVAVTHVQSYCTLYLAGTMLGSPAAGTVAASKLPLTPMTLLQTGWNKIAIPRGAELREARQLRQFLREQVTVTAIVAITVAAYAAALLMSADFLKTVLFNKGYEGALEFIGFWAAINLAGFAGVSASIGLQVMKEFRAIAKINFVTMVVTLALNALLLGQYGIKGGLAASLAGESLLAIGLWLSLLLRLRTTDTEYATGAPFGVPAEDGAKSSPANLLCSICIATYKRPGLLGRLLKSIEEQVLGEGVSLDVIVVDNDAGRSAERVVAMHRDTARMTFRYFVQPVKNISMTRNIAVANAAGDYLLFIDDDEVASPDWVTELVRAAKQYNADGVFGLLAPTFDDDVPKWIRKGERHLLRTSPDLVTGTEAVKTWTGNCLLKASLLKNVSGPFNPEYGITGGEDVELFDRLKAVGARFIYCGEALAFEYFPPERTRLSYLLRRGLHGGNTHTRRVIAFAKRKAAVRLYMLVKAVAFGFLSLAFSILAFPSRMWRTYWQMKVASNVGRFMAAVGQYYRTYS